MDLIRRNLKVMMFFLFYVPFIFGIAEGAELGKNNIKAIISGNNTTKIDLLYLKENLSFNDNDLVYTSGDGGYFNPGIPVGVIKKENNNVYINPLNDLSQVQYINIFINQFKNF